MNSRASVRTVAPSKQATEHRDVPPKLKELVPTRHLFVKRSEDNTRLDGENGFTQYYDIIDTHGVRIFQGVERTPINKQKLVGQKVFAIAILDCQGVEVLTYQGELKKKYEAYYTGTEWGGVYKMIHHDNRDIYPIDLVTKELEPVPSIPATIATSVVVNPVPKPATNTNTNINTNTNTNQNHHHHKHHEVKWSQNEQRKSNDRKSGESSSKKAWSEMKNIGRKSESRKSMQPGRVSTRNDYNNRSSVKPSTTTSHYNDGRKSGFKQQQFNKPNKPEEIKKIVSAPINKSIKPEEIKKIVSAPIKTTTTTNMNTTTPNSVVEIPKSTLKYNEVLFIVGGQYISDIGCGCCSVPIPKQLVHRNVEEIESEVYLPDRTTKVGRLGRCWDSTDFIECESKCLTGAVGVQFPRQIDIRIKAVLLGAIFMMDPKLYGTG